MVDVPARVPQLRARCRSGQALQRQRAATEAAALFDHLVGDGEERGRDGEAESPGGVEVEDQVELRREEDGQV
jgi:hypothetical protein